MDLAVPPPRQGVPFVIDFFNTIQQVPFKFVPVALHKGSKK